METIYNWTIKRSGPGLVVSGISSTNERRKLTKIKSVAVQDRQLVAVAEDGHCYELGHHPITFGGPPRS